MALATSVDTTCYMVLLDHAFDYTLLCVRLQVQTPVGHGAVLVFDVTSGRMVFVLGKAMRLDGKMLLIQAAGHHGEGEGLMTRECERGRKQKSEKVRETRSGTTPFFARGGRTSQFFSVCFFFPFTLFA